MKEDLSEFEIKEPYDPPEMKATIDELQAAKIPREYRDFCAHLLIPLNQCRFAPTPQLLLRFHESMCSSAATAAFSGLHPTRSFFKVQSLQSLPEL